MNRRVVFLASQLILSLAAACGGQTADGTGSTTPAGGGGSSAAGAGGGKAGGAAGTGVGGSAGGNSAGFGGTSNACGTPPPDCGSCGMGGPSYPPSCTPSGWVCPAGGCPPPPPPSCITANQCGKGAYCNAGPGHCPSSATAGVCTPKPQGCNDIYDPHCGCFTGTTYGNECDANQSGEPAFPCNPSGAGGAGGTGAAGFGGSGFGGAAGGPPAFCGGIAGVPCPSGYYCDFPDKKCGGNDGGGTCLPAPIDKCGGDGMVCGCDGKVYGSTCQAELAGVDVSLNQACQQPAGTFACGTHYCKLAEEYCQVDLSDVAGYANGYACHVLPIQCGDGASDCACLAGVPCGAQCKGSSSTGLIAVCPGG